MEKEGGIDRFNKEAQKSLRKYENYIDLETANYTGASNVGTEWLCKQTIDKLQLENFLCKNSWAENTIHTVLSALIVRTVYAVSERLSYYYLRDNSAAGELYRFRHEPLANISTRRTMAMPSAPSRKPAPKWEQASMFVWNKLLNLSLSLLGFFSVSLWREHRHGTFVASSLVEVHHTVGQGIQCVVLALRYILTGVVPVATLANNDVTGNDFLTTPNLYA